ncbi:hypothetical protein SAMN05216324_11473 [Chryseobacterium limigenitum]|uniref:Terpene synthase n=2 Tax=Chryseobacterium limigenitum TaxID=1612149 RepID=A0A1K2IU45_9FLAO|nr:hypothetical protein SAMN05216324_11473 [Chryseobacterium limigenitum]
MKPEDYNPSNYLPQGYYPWPDKINPNVEQMGIDYRSWIDTDYVYLSENIRERYKSMNLHRCSARMYPYASYERVTPMHRYVVFHTIFDDQLEYATEEEVSRYCDRLVAIFRGDSLTPEDPGYFIQAAKIRDEFRAFMPDEWMKRLADTFYTVTRYGAQEEATYKATQTVPSLALFKVLREYSIVIFPYFYLVDAEFHTFLTEEVERHPVIQRVRSVWSRIIAWQNDIQGLKKELSKDTEVMNIVIVLQRNYNLSLEDALSRAMKIHDDDLAELVALQEDLPDFGKYHEEVKQLFLGWGSLIQGLNTFYLVDTNRYDPECFAWPDRETEDTSL